MIERLFIDLGKGPSMFFMSLQMNRKIEETVRVVTYAKNTGQVKQKKSMSVSWAKLALEEKYIYKHPQDFFRRTQANLFIVFSCL